MVPRGIADLRTSTRGDVWSAKTRRNHPDGLSVCRLRGRNHHRTAPATLRPLTTTRRRRPHAREDATPPVPPPRGHPTSLSPAGAAGQGQQGGLGPASEAERREIAGAEAGRHVQPAPPPHRQAATTAAP